MFPYIRVLLFSTLFEFTRIFVRHFISWLFITLLLKFIKTKFIQIKTKFIQIAGRVKNKIR